MGMMPMGPMPPMPPTDPKYWAAEAEHRRQQAKGGGLSADISIAFGFLFKLFLRLAAPPARASAAWWVRRRQRRATR